MYLVRVQRPSGTHLVFTHEDPQKRGFGGHIEKDVTLVYDMEKLYSWREGQPPPDEPCLGRSRDDPKHYVVFRNANECESANYQEVPGRPLVFGTWLEYEKIRPVPEYSDSERWFHYLDEIDEEHLHRRAHQPVEQTPSGTDRHAVAAWLAKTHFFADSKIREVWFLPKGSPPDEIRLLELNDRLENGDSQLAPIDFALDIEGAPFRLYVADVSSEQLLSAIQQSYPQVGPSMKRQCGGGGHDRNPTVVPRAGLH